MRNETMSDLEEQAVQECLASLRAVLEEALRLEPDAAGTPGGCLDPSAGRLVLAGTARTVPAPAEPLGERFRVACPLGKPAPARSEPRGLTQRERDLTRGWTRSLNLACTRWEA